LKIKFLVLTILLAAVAIPVGFVTADLYWDMSLVVEKTDGTGSFTGLDGASGVVTFFNTTNSERFAVVGGFLEDSITLIEITDPTNPTVMDIFGSVGAGGEDHKVDYDLDGPKGMAIFFNVTNANQAGGAGQLIPNMVLTHFAEDTVSVVELISPREQMYVRSNYTDDSRASPTVIKLNKVAINTLSFAGDTGNRLAAIDGPWDVATWTNTTNSDVYAIVTACNSDGVTIFNLSNHHDYIIASGNLTDGIAGNDASDPPNIADTGRPNLELDCPTGIETFYIQQSTAWTTGDGGVKPEKAYAIVTARNDDGFQILDLADPDHYNEEAKKYGYHGGSSAGGVRAAGEWSNATDGGPNYAGSASGYHLLNGAIDVAVWNTTNVDKYAIIVAQDDNAFTIVDISDPTANMGNKQMSNSTTAGHNWNMTSPSAVTVFKSSEHHHIAAIATNSTRGGATISLVDVYNPSVPMPVTTFISDGDAGSDGDIFNSLAGAEGVSQFSLNGVYYLAVTSYRDDGFTIIALNGDRPSTGGASKICGFNYDCEAPELTGISVNNGNLDTSKRYNDVDTTETKVGQLVTIKATLNESFKMYKSNLYFDFQGTVPDWADANAAIRYNAISDSVEVIDTNDIFDADVTSSQDGDTVEVTFKIMFTDTMDTSHMAIQNIDDSTNYQLLYFRDALEVTGTPTQTSLDPVDDEVIQTASATVPGWVKNTAGWWADGAISEGEFVKGIEFLIQEQIIDTDAQTSSSDGTGAAVPDWVKNTAGWWADGAISEGEFVNAIEHLVKTGTIIII
jgi:hypothetical protein